MFEIFHKIFYIVIILLVFQKRRGDKFKIVHESNLIIFLLIGDSFFHTKYEYLSYLRGGWTKIYLYLKNKNRNNHFNIRINYSSHHRESIFYHSFI